MFDDGVVGMVQPVLDLHEVLAALGLPPPDDAAGLLATQPPDPPPGPAAFTLAELEELDELTSSLGFRWLALHQPGDNGPAEVLERVRLLEALSTQLAVWQARELAGLRRVRLAEQDRVHGHGAPAERLDPDGWVPSEVGFALGLSEGQVRRRLAMAEALGRYPAAAGLLEAGRVPAWTGMRLLELLDGLAGLVSPARLAEIETATVAWLSARPRTVSQLTVRMRRLLVAAQAAADATTSEPDPDGPGPDGPDPDGPDGAGPDGAGAGDACDRVLVGRHAQRRVVVSGLADGTAEVWALLPEADALAVAAALDAAVPRLAELPPEARETRTRAQRRADRLVAALTGAPACYGRTSDLPGCSHPDHDGLHPVGAHPDGPHGGHPRARGPVPVIEVAVPVGTLTGGPSPGEVAGYGPVHPATVRDLAADPVATSRTVLYDPATGHLLGLAGPLPLPAPSPPLGGVRWLADLPSGSGHDHPPSVAAAAHARDRTCRAPGCTRRATACDLDHLTPWPDGATSLANTASLCRYHHRLKTHAPGWTVESDPDTGDASGDLVWTTPTGLRHTTSPHDHRPDRTPIEAADDRPPF